MPNAPLYLKAPLQLTTMFSIKDFVRLCLLAVAFLAVPATAQNDADFTSDAVLWRGAVFPEITTAQRNAITGQATGLVVNVGGVLQRWDGTLWANVVEGGVTPVLDISDSLAFTPDLETARHFAAPTMNDATGTPQTVTWSSAINAAKGDAFWVYGRNGSASTRTLSFAASYIDESGATVGSVVIPSGGTFRYRVIAESPSSFRVIDLAVSGTDNLGDHTATQTLFMGGFPISRPAVAVSTVTADFTVSGVTIGSYVIADTSGGTLNMTVNSDILTSTANSGGMAFIRAEGANNVNVVAGTATVSGPTVIGAGEVGVVQWNDAGTTAFVNLIPGAAIAAAANIDEVLNQGGSLTTDRAVVMATRVLTYDGTGDTLLRDTAINESRAWEYTFETHNHVTGVNYAPNLTLSRAFSITGAASTGNIGIDAPSGTTDWITYFRIVGDAGASRDYVFDPAYNQADGSDLGTVTVGTGETRFLSFVRNGATYQLFSDSQGAAASDTSIYTGNGTLTGNRVVDGDSGFAGFGFNLGHVNIGTWSVDAIAGAGNTGRLDIAGTGGEMSYANGTEGGHLMMDGTNGTQLRHFSTAGGTPDHTVTLDAAGVAVDSSTGVYTLGDGAGANLPTTNSDAVGSIVGAQDADGAMFRADYRSMRALSGAGSPVNGTTTAWYAGQQYYDTSTTPAFGWIATAASTDPDAAATGSTWVEADLVTTETIENTSAVTSGRNASTVERTQTFTTVLGGGVQSFTAYVTFGVIGEEATATIYEGAGTGGTIVGTLTHTATSTAAGDYAFTGAVSLQANQQYTIGIVRSSGTGLVGWSLGTGDALPGEVSDAGATDYRFSLTTSLFEITVSSGLDDVLSNGQAMTAARDIDTAGLDLTVSNLATDSDGITSLSGYTAGNAMREAAIDSLRSLRGNAAPADGVTTAWYLGQVYVDESTDPNTVYSATTASTNPDAAATGSVWEVTGSPAIVEAFATNTAVASGELRLIRGNLWRSTSARTTSGALDAAELANWSPSWDLADVTTITSATIIKIAQIGEVNSIDASGGAFAVDLSADGGDFNGSLTHLVVADSTSAVTLNAPGGAITGPASIPAGTPVGTVYHALLLDGTTNEWIVTQLGGAVNGIDTVLAQGEAMTANRTITQGAFNLVQSAVDAETASWTHADTGVFGLQIGDSASLPGTNMTTLFGYGTTGIGMAQSRADSGGEQVAIRVAESVTDPGTTGFVVGQPQVQLDTQAVASGNATDLQVAVLTNGTTGEIEFQDVTGTLSGTAAPVNGVTAAWRVGQIYVDTTNADLYVATAASASPLTSAIGSAWASFTPGAQDLESVINEGGALTGAVVGNIVSYDGSVPIITPRIQQAFLDNGSTTWTPTNVDFLTVSLVAGTYTIQDPTATPATTIVIPVVFRNTSGGDTTVTLPPGSTHGGDVFGSEITVRPGISTYLVRIPPAGNDWSWSLTGEESAAIYNETLNGNNSNVSLSTTNTWSNAGPTLTLGRRGTYLVNFLGSLRTDSNGNTATGTVYTRLTLGGVGVEGSSQRVSAIDGPSSTAPNMYSANKTVIVVATADNQQMRFQTRLSGNNITQGFLSLFDTDDEVQFAAVRLGD